MVTVFFEGLEFYAYHGVPAEERKVGHRYAVDLYLILAKEPSKDDLSQTIDYAGAMEFVQKESTERQFHTVEALASHLADGLLKRYSLVQEVTIKVAKIAPPAPYIAQHAGVELTRGR